MYKFCAHRTTSTARCPASRGDIFAMSKFSVANCFLFYFFGYSSPSLAQFEQLPGSEEAARLRNGLELAMSLIQEGQREQKDFEDRSLYIFAPAHPVRRLCIHLVTSWLYTTLMAITTVTCTIFISIKPPQTTIPSKWDVEVKITDTVFAGLFIFDAILNLIASGFLKYWRTDVFSKIDFCTALLSALDLVLRSWGFNYSLKSMRVFRILKPMLHLKAFAGINAIFQSVVRGSSSLLAILFVTVLALLVFDVLGVELYMGSSRRRCAWMDSLELVIPEKFCKRGRNSLEPNCGLLQQCIET